MDFKRVYNSSIGRLLIDGAIGFVVGYLIYLWRGNDLAPAGCAFVTGVSGLLRYKKIWPFRA